MATALALVTLPTPITVKNAGDAINAMVIARRMGLPSTYLPHGGWIDEHKYTPITHTVYVVGMETEIEKFKLELEKIA